MKNIAPVFNQQVSTWLDSLQHEDLSNTKPDQKQFFLCFVLRKNYIERISICPFMCTQKKTGGFAKTGRVAISARSFTPDSGKNPFHCLQEDDSLFLMDFFRTAKSFADEEIGTLLQFPGSGHILKKIIETGRCFENETFDNPLAWGDARTASFEWKPSEHHDGLKLRLQITDGGEILDTDPLCYKDNKKNTVGFVDCACDHRLTQKIVHSPVIPFEHVQQIHTQLLDKAPTLRETPPQKFTVRTLKVNPRPLITFEKNDDGLIYNWRNSSQPILCATVSFQYENHTLPQALSSRLNDVYYDTITEDEHTIVKIERRVSAENKLLSPLCELGWSGYSVTAKGKVKNYFVPNELHSSDLPIHEQALEIITHHIPVLERHGWKITFNPSFPIQSFHDADELYLEDEKETAGNDWFDTKLGVLINGERVNLVPMLAKLAKGLDENKRWEWFDSLDEDVGISLLTEDKRMIRIPLKWIRNILHNLTIEFRQYSGGANLKLSKWNTAFLSEFALGEAAAKVRWMGSQEIGTMANSLREGTMHESVLAPEGLQCQLRQYQQDGLNWLQQLRRWNMNGILADDMGLGKTVQALAHILVEKAQGRLQSPVLVVAPTSLMYNWRNETARLTPELRALVLHGDDRRASFSKISNNDLILTTYPLLMRDKEYLLSQHFHMIILDEAQTVKNHKTKAYQVLQQIKATHRLCLSGTPMENHLGELWSLFHLLMPGFLGDQKTFQSVYRKPIETLSCQPRRESLIKRIKPFILRRTKQQVAIDLPEKNEIIHTVEFEQPQRDLYEAIRLRAQAKVMNQIQERGLERSQIIVLDALLKLRQVCCDPRLVATEDSIASSTKSAKLECLLDMLTPMVEEGRKILVFSQFSSMLEIIRQEVQERNMIFTMLTGDTKDREASVRQFQEGTASIMLISLKAGGVGLNLTAADTVFHYDPWWNPAAETQATDRAHRIGQKNKLFVYKLIVAGSLEEKIVALQERKKGLIASLFDTGAHLHSKLTEEDIKYIFEPLPAPISH